MHLEGGVVERAERDEIGVAADPDARLVGVQLPLGVRLPGGVVEVGRGPSEVVTGVPDALPRRDGLQGLSGQGGGEDEQQQQGEFTQLGPRRERR